MEVRQAVLEFVNLLIGNFTFGTKSLRNCHNFGLNVLKLALIKLCVFHIYCTTNVTAQIFPKVPGQNGEQRAKISPLIQIANNMTV